jgi:hypothetical protein
MVGILPSKWSLLALTNIYLLAATSNCFKGRLVCGIAHERESEK